MDMVPPRRIGLGRNIGIGGVPMLTSVSRIVLYACPAAGARNLHPELRNTFGVLVNAGKMPDYVDKPGLSTLELPRSGLEERGITKSTCSRRAESRSSNLCAEEGFGNEDQDAGYQAASQI